MLYLLQNVIMCVWAGYLCVSCGYTCAQDICVCTLMYLCCLVHLVERESYCHWHGWLGVILLCVWQKMSSFYP